MGVEGRGPAGGQGQPLEQQLEGSSETPHARRRPPRIRRAEPNMVPSSDFRTLDERSGDLAEVSSSSLRATKISANATAIHAPSFLLNPLASRGGRPRGLT
jgi:hypothetical protein